MKAMEFDVGKTHIEIWDDCVINDPVEVQKIMDRIGQIGMNKLPKKEVQKIED